MGEYVESCLEELLPVFEQLQNTELFSPSEVQQFIRQCRRLEYKLQKREKEAEDFLKYAKHLEAALELIDCRRKNKEYNFRKREIERGLELRVAALYRQTCDRFQGRKEIWHQRFEFLRGKGGLRKQLSAAYTRYFHVFPRDTAARCDAARWEWQGNGSAENSRLLLQMGIRLEPTVLELYLELYRMEICYVQKLMERKAFLTAENLKQSREQFFQSEKVKENGDDVDVFASLDPAEATDEVLQLRLAEVVAEQALKQLGKEREREILLALWQTARSTRASVAAPLIEKLREGLESTEDQFKYLMLADAEKNDIDHSSKLLEGVAKLKDSPEMARAAYEWHLTKSGPILEMRRAELLEKLTLKGWVEDPDEVLQAWREASTAESSGKLLEIAMNARPDSEELWVAKLRAEIARLDQSNVHSPPAKKKSKQASKAPSDGKQIADIFDLFNEAFEKVHPDASLPIWQLAVDFATSYAPDQVTPIFTKGLATTSSEVRGSLKVCRLEWLAGTGMDVEQLKKEAETMIADLPNSLTFYSKLDDFAANRQFPFEWRLQMWRRALTELGQDKNETVWLSALEFVSSNKKGVREVGPMVQRALLALKATDAEQRFLVGWQKIQQPQGRT